MAAQDSGIDFPDLPVGHDEFIKYIADHPDKPILELVEPFKLYDAEMRKVFAQRPNHVAIQKPNIVPVFAGQEEHVKIRARRIEHESQQEREAYIMPLNDEDRKPDAAPAIVQSLKDFRTNFSVFSESALADLDWSNVVAAGSAVVTSLLAVPNKRSGSKRALREYYHEQFAPASDVDLFIYGLSEEQALAKIKQIEQNIRDAILVETTTIRTKNAITIASQYPTRHVQIVLRIYKSVSEILTGFDVDCSCAAYDGKQVYASPRALAAYMTQVNTIDLTRRSPSYESRLSKYAHRGFEVYWPHLERSRIDPTIFERSFGRTEGLARLLILEKLPKSQDRDNYLDQRRAERGRPAINRWRLKRRMIRGNIKNDWEDEVAEWVDAEDVSNYHTFTIPYGPTFHARKIEKLLYTKDLLLNAEWNLPKDREVHLHRHPAFFGRTDDVFHDCCGMCPQPKTVEEEEVATEEGKVYISGEITFIRDDPGRQTIGSFNPLTPDDWTEMAYVGNTELLCRAIVDGDNDYVSSWLQQDGNDPNTRDYTGRTPLHLAAANSTPEVVQTLIDGGARLVARLVDGKTALHLAAMRGNVAIVSALLRKSEANEQEEEKKLDAKRAARRSTKENGASLDVAMKEANISGDDAKSQNDEDSDIDMVDDADDDDLDATTENSIVNIRNPAPEQSDKVLDGEDEKDEPDYYDVNVLAWDTPVSPLHLAITSGHIEVVKLLVQEFGADVLLPIKLFNEYDKSARAAILTLVLALQLPQKTAEDMVRALFELGASCAQADLNQTTALHYCVADRVDLLDTFIAADQTGVNRAINHLAVVGNWYSPRVASVLMSVIKARDSLTALKLLSNGAKPEVDFASYMTAYQSKREPPKDSNRNKADYQKTVEQPIYTAVSCELPELAKTLVEQHGVDVNTLSTSGWQVVNEEYARRYTEGSALLDKVRQKIKELKEWKPSELSHKPPIPLKEDTEYLSGLVEGTYARWSAEKQLQAAKERYDREYKEHQKMVESAKDRTGYSEKQKAVEDMLSRFESLEHVLIERGAKTFHELYPDIQKPEPQTGGNFLRYGYSPEKAKEFAVEHKFFLSDLTDELHGRYMDLFEAAWKADLGVVKRLTLLPWKNSNDEDKPPLRITVLDGHNMNPFAIAVLNGHFELATAIMEIAQAQYAPDDQGNNKRYRLGAAGDTDSEAEDDDDNDDDNFHIYSELVDEQFTVETIGEVSTQVKSKVLPTSMLHWPYPVADFMGAPLRSSSQSSGGFSYFGPRRQHTMAGKRTNTGSLKAASNHLSEQKRKDIGTPNSLIQFALHNDDQDLLIYLLSLGNDLAKAAAKQDDEDAYRFFTVNESDYLEAIKLNRPHLLAEIIKRCGAGIPLNKLMKRSGVEVKEKPKYYQGLSVYGKKRKDWADAGRGHTNQNVVESHRPGLLEAARHQSLETVEWFLSDAPMRCYQEFATTNKDDKRIKVLSEAKGGIEASVSRFLNARAELAMHCSIMGKPVPESIPMLRYLIKVMPEAIDAKSQEGITPLQISFWLYREEAAKVLVNAGADQTCRDRVGNNLVHSLLHRPVWAKKKLATLPRMLDLIDKRLLADMLLERSSDHPGALTPLAQWLRQASGNKQTHAEAVLRLLLQYSEGKELNFINGEGHTPIHVTVGKNDLALTRVLLERQPTLLVRENATGRTPFEMGEDGAIAETCADAPPLPENSQYFERRQRKNGLIHGWTQNVVDRSPDSFVKEAEKDQRNDREKIWDLMKEVLAKLEAEGRAKRRLVTLNEANEVARRLAASKRGHRYRRSQADEDDDKENLAEDTQDGVDEVGLWKGEARSYLFDDMEEAETSHGGQLFGGTGRGRVR